MSSSRDPRLQLSAVRSRYGSRAAYNDSDSWHHFTAREVEHLLHKLGQRFPDALRGLTLNAGSGGNDLGMGSANMINLDLSAVGISLQRNPVVANIESIPLADSRTDTIVCVGSVINYCDAAAAISEFSRVLRDDGYLFLEFESSRSAELMVQPAFGQSAAVAETFCAARQEAVWVYSLEYIRNLLHSARFQVLVTTPIHVVSPWALLLLKNLKIAAAFARLDPLARRIPLARRWASNYLLLCRRKSFSSH